jgi:predicted Zn-dependent protease
MRTKIILLAVLTAALFSTCTKKPDPITPAECFSKPSCELADISFLITKSQDVQLGAQVAAQIAADPTTYPLLDSSKYPVPYQFLHTLKDDILNSGQVATKSDFVWKLKIIQDDKTLNAFCTPGGYIYVYTGLMKYLRSKSAIAGVMGHEIAHADQRHSTQSMITQYGVDFLINIISGDKSKLGTLVANLGLLKYSRCHESQADYYSVQYLGGTNKKYYCDGAAEFFKQIAADGGSTTPVFLSTHPSPDNRVADITKAGSCASCARGSDVTSIEPDYKAIIDKLP